MTAAVSGQRQVDAAHRSKRKRSRQDAGGKGIGGFRSVFSLRDLARESLAGVLQRPGRTVLTVLGTVLGVGAFVGVLGLTTTASGQISKRFTVLLATSVSVEDVGTGDSLDQPLHFPANADAQVRRLTGVRQAGVWWTVPGEPNVSAIPDGSVAEGLPVLAATPGALRAMRPTVGQGVLYNRFHEGRQLAVAVLGRGAATRLGISTIDLQPAVFVNGIPFTVIGILDDVQRMPESLSSVLIPRNAALKNFGPPEAGQAEMLIETELGAAPVVGRQVPVALRPEQPEVFRAIVPPDPRSLSDGVSSDLGSLFVLLGFVCLVIGAVGIANTTLVSVLERRAEIGVRRALGARPRHIAAQFLAESAALGTVGGLIGTATGVLTTLLVATVRDWTAVLEPAVVLPAPALGTLVGLAAGAYPAWRAARMEPVEALRQ